jgi:hypothetical protein
MLQLTTVWTCIHPCPNPYEAELLRARSAFQTLDRPITILSFRPGVAHRDHLLAENSASLADSRSSNMLQRNRMAQLGHPHVPGTAGTSNYTFTITSMYGLRLVNAKPVRIDKRRPIQARQVPVRLCHIHVG